MEWNLRTLKLDLSEPKVMGILNLTPDSFSDGGLYVDPAVAIDHALKMEAEGADLIDLGGESTRPGAAEVSEQEEWGRIEPVLKILSGKLKIPLSVDTRHPGVAERALEEGVQIINDVSGGRDLKLLEKVAQAGSGYVLMHMRGNPSDMMEHTQYGDLLGDIGMELSEAHQRVIAIGVKPATIALDPGFGFAKTPRQNYQLLNQLDQLSAKGGVWLVGLSRKRMLRELVGEASSALQAASVSACLLAYQKGAKIFRVHDVAPSVLALKSFAMLANGPDLKES